jgi:hypothetical protein
MEQKVSESGRCDGVTAKIGDGEPQADGIPRRAAIASPATQQKGGAVIRTAALMKELSH